MNKAVSDNCFKNCHNNEVISIMYIYIQYMYDGTLDWLGYVHVLLYTYIHIKIINIICIILLIIKIIIVLIVRMCVT